MTLMTKLKIGTVEEDKPVTLTIKLPAGVHRDLAAYAEILVSQSGQPISDPIKLIAPMLARFMASDRAFSRFRKMRQTKVASESKG
jgi:hypothetical protein